MTGHKFKHSLKLGLRPRKVGSGRYKCKFYEQSVIQQLVTKMQTIATLPKRTTGAYLKGFQKETLKTNLYKVDFSDKSTITIYSVAVHPQLPFDSNKLNLIVESAQSQLKQLIGNYLLCGRNIYGCQSSKAKPKTTPITVQCSLDSQTFTLTLKSVRTVDLSALGSSKSADTFLPINFMNNLIKRFFSTRKFVSIGKCGKYFNPKTRKTLANSGIILFNGYQTKFTIAENGLYLQVDSMVRIIQSKTVLEEINTLYSKNSHLSKDEKRAMVKSEIIGKAVMANYGNSRIWIVQEIIFDFDLQNTKIGDENNMSFVEYYQKNYNLKINSKKQPVLKAIMNGMKRNKVPAKPSILIPEFLLMSGLPDDFDERKRRDISQYTIIQPEEKLNRIEALISSFNSQNENFCPNSVSETLGVKISPVTETVESTILPPPFIQLGKGQSVEKGKVASFQLFNKEIFDHTVPMNIVVLIPSDYDFSGIEKLFSSTCRNLCIKHTLNIIKLSYQDSKKAIADIERYIQDKEGKLDDYDLNWFILPPQMKSQYKTIKRLSLKNNNPKATQVTLTTTLAKKGFASILTKVLLQISSKIGNVPWAPRVSPSVNPKTILIGIDTCKDTGNKSYNVVGYCCTIDKNMSKFHSSYHYQALSSNFSVKIRDIISDCLAAYGKANSFLPDQIVIIKADISDGEKDSIVSAEVNQVKAKIKEMNGYAPKLTFLTANKNSKQKFFLQGRSITNPVYGTLVNSKIVSKFYDFYLIAQHCNRGTVKPIHYKVLYTDSKMQEGVLQELIYCQSFNYMNWSGSIRVPSVLQYATKLSNFVAEYISKAPETEILNELLYFI